MSLPAGEIVDGRKCFTVEEYKAIVVVHSRYLSCALQSDRVSALANVLADKQAVLERTAAEMEATLHQSEAERKAYADAATAAQATAAIEARSKRLWRAVAVVSAIAALTLGAVVGGLEASR